MRRQRSDEQPGPSVASSGAVPAPLLGGAAARVLRAAAGAPAAAVGDVEGRLGPGAHRGPARAAHPRAPSPGPLEGMLGGGEGLDGRGPRGALLRGHTCCIHRPDRRRVGPRGSRAAGGPVGPVAAGGDVRARVGPGAPI